jgi:zinc transport system substrate-binding protein
MRKLICFSIPILSALLLLCCGKPEVRSKIDVTASLYPLADVVRNVGGEQVDVHVFIPPGASPHTFEPTPEQFRGFSKTKLFIEVGAGLEFWADKLIRASADPSLRTIRASDGVDLIGLDGQDEHGGSEAGNPHVWLDPWVIKDLAGRIAEALVEIDPVHERTYRENAHAYQTALDSLDREIRTAVGEFRTKEYVAFHPAWAYFARRYGLKEIGMIESSPGRDPTPKELENIVEDIRKYGIRAVFAEPQLNPRAAEVIAEEASVRVLLLDPLGGPDLPERNTYLGLMRYNLRVMSEVMR